MRRVLFKELPQNRRFGVELELSSNLPKETIGDIVADYALSRNPVKVTPGEEGWAHTVQNDYWHVKFDRSCGDPDEVEEFGWEIASYIGCGNYDLDNIAALAPYLRDRNARTNRRCGLHIHVETLDYDVDLMASLHAAWIKIEYAMFMICHPCRRTNEYCRNVEYRWHNAQYEHANLYYRPDKLHQFWQHMKPHCLTIHNNYDKKYALNSVGFQSAYSGYSHKRNTLELRLPECILDEKHIANWTRLFLNFVETCTLRPAPNDLYPASNVNEVLFWLGLKDNDNFYILDNDLLETKLWLLNKLMNVPLFQDGAESSLAFASQI